jgi:protoheme IX farnesyltransferase
VTTVSSSPPGLRDRRAAAPTVTAPTASASTLSDSATEPVVRAYPYRYSRMRTVRGYIALTKPRIIELLLVTTVPAMMLAQGGVPPLDLVLRTLIGGTLAAGSANALNCYLDRDIDVLMRRTGHRPLALGTVSPRGALIFGLGLGVISVAFLALTVNVLSAALALFAILFYVVGYTMILKRRTPQNIVWGGIAGCLPPLIGWTAVTNQLDAAPFVLFGIVFLWTPPHYWPLSLRYKQDYATAGVPMLPVVAGLSAVSRQIVRYSWAMVAWSLLLIPVAPTGPVYAVAAVVLGGMFILEAHRLHRRSRAATEAKDGDADALAAVAPMRLFHWSITYLALLFVAVAVDPLVRF